MKSHTITIAGGPIHYVDYGGEGTPVVLVHGLGGSHLNWMAVAKELAQSPQGYRVLAPDLVGFGRTPPAGRSSAVDAQVEVVSTFLDKVAGGPSVLVGNSMGGLISMLTAAAHPTKVTRLVLVNASLPRPRGAPLDPVVGFLFMMYMTPFAGELFLRRRTARVGPEKMLRSMLRLCGVDPSRVLPEMYQASIALAEERLSMPWAHPAFLRAARSLLITNARRAYVHERIQSVRAPTLLLQGTADRLVPFEVAKDVARLRPDWQFEILDGVGHTPQIEVPDRWIELVTRFLTQRENAPRVIAPPPRVIANPIV